MLQYDHWLVRLNNASGRCGSPMVGCFAWATLVDASEVALGSNACATRRPKLATYETYTRGHSDRRVVAGSTAVARRAGR